MRYLLNSAVITSPGLYEYKLISLDEFRRLLPGAESYIGYQETVEAIKILTGVEVELNRGTIKMKEGDEALVFRLTSRVAIPALKGEVGIETLLQNLEIGLLKRLI